ncbi:hypothetical protein EV421DRAFT_2022165 [Armillaria borealis]|uniref:Uncharacterized protein n=1 Tax=Armillaria borealis TaxID=47425 RepID=A0AA39MJK3_9AGAR|nr:hypothetical protein EV421DRAFT_2022165 [Armillaria borealis]
MSNPESVKEKFDKILEDQRRSRLWYAVLQSEAPPTLEFTTFDRWMRLGDARAYTSRNRIQSFPLRGIHHPALGTLVSLSMSDTDGLSSDFLQRVCDEYLNATFVESVTHGMCTFIFIAALTKLSLSLQAPSTIPRHTYTHHRALFVVPFVMYTQATVHLAFRWELVRSSFVIHGPEHSGYRIITCQRCWTFWNQKWRMITVSVLCTIGSTIFNVFYIIQNLDALGTHPFQVVIGGTDWAIAYYSMTLSTTIICTALILYPMLTTEAPSGPKTNLYTYHRVITILIESSALYAFSLVLFLISYATI